MKYGIVGYKENWYAGEFPLSSYLKLKKLTQTGRTFPIELMNKDEINEYWRSSLNDEIELLQKLASGETERPSS